MKNRRTRAILAIISNCIIILTTAAISVSFFLLGTDETANFAAFHYFTTLSNLLAALTAVPLILCLCRGLRKNQFDIPAWIHSLRFVGTTAVTVTITTVLFFLAPQFHFAPFLFVGINFFLHILNPILAILSFVLFEADSGIPKKSLPLAVLPTLLYGIVYVVMVVFIGEENGGWRDFYGFNIGGFWYISMAVMLAGTFALAALLRWLRNRNAKKLAE